MTGAKKAVIGASGFLGSHITRQLVYRPTRDHGKPSLGWQSNPIRDSIRRAAQFYRQNRRDAKKQVVDYACLLQTPG
jgi:nucleoside-diphosphate-sugar epimerase